MTVVLLDRLWLDAFPDEPDMLDRLRSEMVRLGFVSAHDERCKRKYPHEPVEHCWCWMNVEEECCFCGDNSEGEGEDGVCPASEDPHMNRRTL